MAIVAVGLGPMGQNAEEAAALAYMVQRLTTFSRDGVEWVGVAEDAAAIAAVSPDVVILPRFGPRPAGEENHAVVGATPTKESQDLAAFLAVDATALVVSDTSVSQEVVDGAVVTKSSECKRVVNGFADAATIQASTLPLLSAAPASVTLDLGPVNAGSSLPHPAAGHGDALVTEEGLAEMTDRLAAAHAKLERDWSLADAWLVHIAMAICHASRCFLNKWI